MLSSHLAKREWFTFPRSAKERINRVEDVLTLGDKVTVVCLGKDKMGRMSFSIKDVPAEAK
ncbi:MAG: hypothetical protein ACLTER_20275 [Ruminococcus sp.]